MSYLQESNQTQNNQTSENPSVFLRLRTVNEIADQDSEFSIAGSSLDNEIFKLEQNKPEDRTPKFDDPTPKFYIGV